MDLKKTAQYQRINQQIARLYAIGQNSEAKGLEDKLSALEERWLDGAIKAPKESIITKTSRIEDQTIKEELNKMTELISQTLSEVKNLIGLKASLSIDYDAINHSSVRKRLIADNIRMENIALNVALGESERFYSFCTNAFYQIENLLNYYFYVKYPDFNECLKYFKNKGTVFERGDPRKLSDIKVHSKLQSFEQDFYYDSSGETYYESTLELIKYVRNTEEHRCDVFVREYSKFREAYTELIKKISNTKASGFKYTESKSDKEIRKQGRIAHFLKEHDFDLVRNEVSLLYQKVISNLPS